MKDMYYPTQPMERIWDMALLEVTFFKAMNADTQPLRLGLAVPTLMCL